MIPSSAFQPIIEEIHRSPLPVNYYRKRTGEGRSQAFGIVGKRSMPPDYSRMCWKKPYLYKLLLDFGEKYVDISWNAITLNHNFQCGPHTDKNNIGDSFIVAFGEFQDGELLIHDTEICGFYDIRHTPIKGDFSKMLHSVAEYTGERFSLVYYQYHDPRWTFNVPPPSVVQINGEWIFKRGDVLIRKNEGLPHPRCKKLTSPS
jgi:hypothetical protein